MANTWTAFERENNAALKQEEKKANETVLCASCGCKFFHQVEAFQFRANHQLVVGQKVPPIPGQSTPYLLLQCIRCGDYTEPNVDSDVVRDAASQNYNTFLDELEGNGDKREKKEDLIAKLEARIAELEAKPKPKGAAKKDDAVQDKE